MRQHPRLLGSGQYFIIPDAVQITLRDGDVFMSHQPRKAVQIQPVFELHVRKSVPTGMR